MAFQLSHSPWISPCCVLRLCWCVGFMWTSFPQSSQCWDWMSFQLLLKLNGASLFVQWHGSRGVSQWCVTLASSLFHTIVPALYESSCHLCSLHIFTQTHTHTHNGPVRVWHFYIVYSRKWQAFNELFEKQHALQTPIGKHILFELNFAERNTKHSKKNICQNSDAWET